MLTVFIRWRKSGDDEWSCALHGRILSLRQDSQHLHYRAIFPSAPNSPPTPPLSDSTSTDGPNAHDDEATLALLHHYFNLTPNLGQLYSQWSSADANFRKKAPRFTGVRVLQQDAWEALVGFICSSNNNIARISQMVEKLCVHYGPLIGHVGGAAYHGFPPPAALTGEGVEQRLRQLGFGYRAKYLWKTACVVAGKGEAWLEGLRNPERPVLGVEPRPAGEMVEGGREGYRRAHEQLLELQGVGPKVADCVCLMGLGWGEAVPVDTHGRCLTLGIAHCEDVLIKRTVWQIAQRDYKFGKGRHSSLTKATYDAVANKFRSLWGKEAGWAHSVLFTADLKAFSEKLVAKTEVMEEKELVKVEEDGAVTVEDVTKTREVLDKRVKRESEQEEHQVLEVHDTIVKKSKRRKRG